MAEKFNSEESLSPKELAQHLRKPTGEKGKEIAEQMNKGNKEICLNTYKVLNPENGNKILEIGMGNGFFVQDLLYMAEDLYYVGADFSPEMVDEAKRINENFINLGKAHFICASIDKIPFEADSFDCITTTNTIYFWHNPNESLIEILRVLKPGGKFLCAYRSKSCMDQIAFTKHGFTKFTSSSVESLFSENGFNNVTTEIIKESDLEFDGQPFEMAGIYTSGFKKK